MNAHHTPSTLATRHRIRIADVAPWVIALAAFFLFPRHLQLGTQVMIMVLFALSLDLLLGYAGIVTLGHAAFFGIGAYCCGILSVRTPTASAMRRLSTAARNCAPTGVFSTTSQINANNAMPAAMIATR